MECNLQIQILTLLFHSSKGNAINHLRFQRSTADDELSFPSRGFVAEKLRIPEEKYAAMLLVAEGCNLLLEPRTPIHSSLLNGFGGSAPSLSHLPFNHSAQRTLKPMSACHILLTSNHAHREHIKELLASYFV